MAGNVWEWVNDWYGENYYYDSPPSNPLGPDSGTKHIIRGGAWVNNMDGDHATDRFRSSPDDDADGVGFRCASPLP
jgi:formylglycine-generating enzyme required for sulfatase activity